MKRSSPGIYSRGCSRYGVMPEAAISENLVGSSIQPIGLIDIARTNRTRCETTSSNAIRPTLRVEAAVDGDPLSISDDPCIICVPQPAVRGYCDVRQIEEQSITLLQLSELGRPPSRAHRRMRRAGSSEADD